MVEKREGGKLFGHELLDSFISMYNDKNSVFAQDQAEVMKDILAGKLAKAESLPYGKVTGYITAPVAGMRILEGQTITARLNEEAENVEFRLEGSGEPVVIPAKMNGKKAEAVLDGDTLAELGEVADGRVGLYAGGEKLQEVRVIFNIAPRSDDPLLIDDFESYAGLMNLLLDSWSSNKDSGCELTVSLSDEWKHGGEYALKFDYMETRNGWAGCEFPKEADWSDCDALQLWVKPDGNNQKTVVQISTASGGSYEAYLQEYPEYASVTDPMLVTLPFGEFRDKNGKGALSPEAASDISGFGLWVNAIGDSPAIDENGEVRGVLYYDDIRAVASGKTAPAFVVTEHVEGEDGMSEVVGGSTADGRLANGVDDGSAASEAAGNVSWAMYGLPVISGLIALAATGCLAALMMKKKRQT